MHFSRLRLTGFKSFVDPTDLYIEPGLTGIVGPNGCGKSNLVEALRWVMGETSAKQMRGGEMDDVIFGGTAERPARNLAEVILTLDNSDRGGPPHFNDSDELDVVRRIERGAGSAYKINGKEFRARDVQTLFADAASGARSTALVSQGRIGAIINAKPKDRRHLLEEAAGITGLHSRRHEAELRLKAAEANLERLDDVLGALDEQFRNLKRQARQATRYRNLSDHIRNAEAVVLYYRWSAANAQRAAAAEDLNRAEEAVTEFTRQVAIATTEQANASQDIPALRQAEAEAAAALQRLLVARDALDAEEERLANQRRELEARLGQINTDVERAKALQNDANEAVQRLDGESAQIRAAQENEGAERSAAEQDLAAARTETEKLESALSELQRAVTADETRAGALRRQIDDLGKRRDRAVHRSQEVAQQREQAIREAEDNGELEQARALTAEHRTGLEDAKETLVEAEQARVAAQTADTEAREALQLAEAGAAKLRAEENALTDLLEVGDPQLWPPMIDAVTVAPGYEIALGAALGEELVAPADDAAPVHWRLLPPYDAPAVLPEGATPLTRFVTGPAALQRRLTQIGVVDTEAQGVALSARLAQGQRLVSKDGGFWRWDGYTAAVGAPTAAAARLAQRNRLADLREELKIEDAKVAAARQRFEEINRQAREAFLRERESRESVWERDRLFQEARDRETALTESTANARSKLETLSAAAEQLAADLAEIEVQLGEVQSELDELAGLPERKAEIVRRQQALGEARRLQSERQSAFDRLAREAETRRMRLQVITTDLESWRGRIENARTHIAQLDERRQGIAKELEVLAIRPQEIATQRGALFEQIELAEGKRGEAGDALANAEMRLSAAGQDLRAKEAQLAESREERVRRQANIEQIDQSLTTIAERVRERLDCEPDGILAVANLTEDSELPEVAKIEEKLDRLVRERDTMGPVNLRAEVESEELNDKITTMQGERDDLIAAIAKLRQGISGLNREGRERLLTAFKEVDEHFQDLFKRLFGGGRAHLSLTEAEDPLDAGLEIMASPPGKKLQIMSLLSGGEQALTALALLFAVFMTNPAPICVLDEVDAPLDDHNVDRFCRLVGEIAEQSQTRFLLVTHHRLTMSRVDRLYGVTMAERGISQLVSVDLETAAQLRESA